MNTYTIVAHIGQQTVMKQLLRPHLCTLAFDVCIKVCFTQLMLPDIGH